MSMIKIYNQTLSPEFCQSIIDMFEDKTCCKTKHGFDLSYKINPHTSPEWVKIINKLKESRDHFATSYLASLPELEGDIKCGGYVISRYSPVSNATQFYGISGKFSIVWFLNNINIGGYIVLSEGNQTIEVRPETGKLIIFPNESVQLKRQLPGSSSKYLIINNIS